MFHPASPASIAAFLAVNVFVVAAFLRGVWLSALRDARNPVRRTAGTAEALVLWLGVAAALVASGWVGDRPVHLVVFGAGNMVLSFALGISPLGKSLARAFPLPWLLGFQGFRLPLELVLHAWVGQGVIPSTMTWTGANWDILSGILALVLAPFAEQSRLAAWVGNMTGFALLLNVGRVAILSAPVPFGWANVTPKLQLPFHLPYALIVPVCVGGALAGHIILTRALLFRRATA